MSIMVVGADKLITRLAAGVAASDAALEVAKDTLGHEVLDGALERVPVLTGNLRDSLAYVDGRVFTDVVYAGQVEYGGLHNPPEPYMRPAADTADDTQAMEAAKAVIQGV